MYTHTFQHISGNPQSMSMCTLLSCTLKGIYINTYVCVCVNAYTYVLTDKCIYKYVHKNIYMSIYTHTCIPGNPLSKSMRRVLSMPLSRPSLSSDSHLLAKACFLFLKAFNIMENALPSSFALESPSPWFWGLSVVFTVAGRGVLEEGFRSRSSKGLGGGGVGKGPGLREGLGLGSGSGLGVEEKERLEVCCLVQ